MDPYILAKLIGTRAKELDEGHMPYIENKSCRSSIALALKEYDAGKLENYTVVLTKPGGGEVEMTIKEIKESAGTSWR